MDDIISRLIELPSTVNGVTVVDADGNYNVYINSRLSADEQKRAYEHELRHIQKQHFYDFNPIEENEQEAKSGPVS